MINTQSYRIPDFVLNWILWSVTFDLYIKANKRRKKQGKEHDKLKSERSESIKDDSRDSTSSNRAGYKSGGGNRGNTNANLSGSTSDRGTASNIGGKKSVGGNSGAQASKRNKGNKRSANTASQEKAKYEKDLKDQKDDSDEIDLSTIEIDPDEPTYCLCDQVRAKSLYWISTCPIGKSLEITGYDFTYFCVSLQYYYFRSPMVKWLVVTMICAP